MTLKNNRAPLLCCFQLYAWFHSHQWIQTKVTVRKRSIRVKIGDLLSIVPCDLEIWRMTLKSNRAPLLSNISAPYVNSNWSYSPETAKLGYDLCDRDLWPWPFAWTSLLSLVITPENFVMIRWWEHSQKGVTDRRTETEPFIELLGRS